MSHLLQDNPASFSFSLGNVKIYDYSSLKDRTMKPYILAVSLLCFIIAGCSTVEQYRLIRAYEPVLSNASPVDTTVTNVTANRDSRGRQAGLISAFYGLDNALPKVADRGIWPGAGGTDGMPVIFSHEIDYKTMQVGDFRVTTASGKVGKVLAVTLAPADDKGEHRTALFAGSYGSIDDQPVKVEVVSNLLSLDGTLNFKGASVNVTPLEKGATMVWAETVPEGEWDIGKEASPLPWGGGSGCTKGTKQVVRVTWSGGVTKPGGDEVDDVERVQYKVTVLLKDGRKIEVTPFALGDLGDGDNNHELCLDVVGTPQSVYFPAGYMTDTREDLNPETTITIRE
ncbi:MAG: hypothetical protein HC908_07090 [Calothrix sp. SM1_7_51]|nr:hypothetical protein [Calothrix sp. SM1_7_51]